MKITLRFLFPLLSAICLFNCVRGRPKKMIAQPDNNSELTCGYQSCPKSVPGMLNVHLVPHTHDDVGWLKTVDQYYYGSKTFIQKAGVQYIIDSVIKELIANPQRKFIYVETAFLWKWWQQQGDHVRHQVKYLINNGQLEIIGGAWSMNDEATTHYHSIVDQFTWGFRRLNDTFGHCARPKIGWQIDPFGHSREMASLFAQFGFDGLLFGRLDYEDKMHRLINKTAEMVWKGSANLGNSADLFTSVLYNQYQPPPGFCFDVLCSDEPIIDDLKSKDYNVDSRVAGLIKYIKEQSMFYTTNNIILTMGGDFTYQDAHMWYHNLDKLIRYVNKLQKNGSDINVFYSTPSCYLKAVNEKNLQWTEKTDDFFPYSSDPHTFWTGYFTSRPTIKYYERKGNNMLQVCKQLAIYDSDENGEIIGDKLKGLINLREALGIMQHHDAVTGTEKQHVANDYAHILSDAIEQCAEESSKNLNYLLRLDSKSSPELILKQCHGLNISECNITEKSTKFIIVLYNPSSRNLTQYVRVPVNYDSYNVKDPKGNDIINQIVPIPEIIQNMPGRFSLAKHELVFAAVNIPALGYQAYYISQTDSFIAKKTEHINENDDQIENEHVQIGLDKNTGHVASIKFGDSEIPIKQEYMYYVGAVGNNAESKNRSSGAYIFRPNGTVKSFGNPQNSIYKGEVVEELHQVFSPWITQVVRIYKLEKHVEFDWIVGPIPINDNLGKEIISRFSTHLETNKTFYTDSNGREMLRRVLNKRETWPVNLIEPVAGNYYPVTSKITLRDEKNNIRLSVLNDRAQGGSSLSDGSIELMVHRRLLNDDAFGVDEALNETAYGHQGLVARGQHFVIGGQESNTLTPTVAAQERELAQRKLLAPWPFLVQAENLSFADFQKLYKLEYQGLAGDKVQLPSNIQILTLEPWKNNTVLLRLEHVLEKGEDPQLSQPTSVNIQELFKAFKIIKLKETTLGGNQWLSENEPLKWKSVKSKSDLYDPLNTNEVEKKEFEEQYLFTKKQFEMKSENPAFEVVLMPMQIRTFILFVEKLQM